MNFYVINASDEQGREIHLVLTGNVEIESYPPSLNDEEHTFKIKADKLEIGDNKDKIGVWQWGGMK